MIKNLIDTTKAGTLIITTPRTGAHFLEQFICTNLPELVRLREISDYSQLSAGLQKGQYFTAIINDLHFKFWLLSQLEVLENFHVVILTRKDKVMHWISTYLFRQGQNKKIKSPIHNATKNQIYTNFINENDPIELDLCEIANWMLEIGLLDNGLPCNYKIDYSQLIDLYPGQQAWTPNDYQGIGLDTLFINHEKIEYLLKNCIIENIRK
jgi:hypothetical protein